MNNIKKTVIGITIAVAMGATLGQPVWANANEAEAALEASDLTYAFGQTVESAQVATLSEQEMKETEGAVLPWLVGGGVGGFIGGGGYAYGWYQGNYAWNTSRFLGNIGTGALVGATFGTAGALAGGGFSLGANVWRFNSVVTNWGINQAWRR